MKKRYKFLEEVLMLRVIGLRLQILDIRQGRLKELATKDETKIPLVTTLMGLKLQGLLGNPSFDVK